MTLVLTAAFPLAAQDPDISPVGPEAGQALAAELRSMRLEESAKGVLKIRARDGRMTEIPILAQPIPGDARWKMVYQTTATDGVGAEQLTIIHTTNGPNQYLYSRAASPTASPAEPSPLPASQAAVPLATSDFWLTDLGFEFYHWPQQIQHKGEIRRTRSCFVLESINPAAKPGDYARVVSWIDKETGAPIEAEAYGTDGKVLKEFEIGKVKKINGHYELKSLKMGNRKQGTRTTLEFDLEGKE